MSEYSEIKKSEEQLRTLFERNGLKFIEANLKFVDRNVRVGQGVIDTLALDEQNRPVIIEYKVNDEASADALVQALSYAYQLDNDQDDYVIFIKERIQGVKEDEIDFDKLRIVIVAPEFSYHVLNAAKRVKPLIKLVRFKIYIHGNQELLMTETIYDSSESSENSTRTDYTIDYHFSGRYASKRPIFDKLAERIKERFGVEPYYRQEFIAFKRRKTFVLVYGYIDRMEVGLPLPGEQPPSPRFIPTKGRMWPRMTHYVKLYKPEDVDDELIEWIEKAYHLS